MQFRIIFQEQNWTKNPKMRKKQIFLCIFGKILCILKGRRCPLDELRFWKKNLGLLFLGATAPLRWLPVINSLINSRKTWCCVFLYIYWPKLKTYFTKYVVIGVYSAPPSPLSPTTPFSSSSSYSSPIILLLPSSSNSYSYFSSTYSPYIYSSPSSSNSSSSSTCPLLLLILLFLQNLKWVDWSRFRLVQ